jgi:hypothetical protein
MLIVIALLLATAANAEPLLLQPQPQPQPKIGAVCPSSYQSSGGYCVPGPSTKCRMMTKLTSTCPVGYTASFDYCVETSCQKSIDLGLSAWRQQQLQRAHQLTALDGLAPRRGRRQRDPPR